MLSDLYIRLRSLVRRRRVESELDTELQFHMEKEIQKRIGQGMTPDDAARRVRMEFGGVSQIKEDCRQARGVGLVENLIRDFQYGARKLIHDWRFSLAALVILTLGIGANTAMFSFVNSVAFRPEPFEEPDRIVDIYQDSDEGDPTSSSFPAYRDMATLTDVFSGVAARYPTTVQIETGDTTRTGLVEYATSSLFPVLGVRPSIGRWFSKDDDAPGSQPAAVLTRRSWVNRWDGDPNVVGQTVRIGGIPVTVVGIGPDGFAGGFPGVVFDAWLSLSSLGPIAGPYAAGTLDRRQDHWFMVQARLAEGVGITGARAAVDTLAGRLAEDYPELNQGREITVFESGEVRLHPSIDAIVLPTATLLLVVMGLVLAIAASNLAILLLVRGTFRAREVAVRLAMGATRRRIVSQFLVESIMLALAGGGLGLLLADRVLGVIMRLESAAPVPLTADLSIDTRVLMFTLALAMATGIAFGLVPALRSSKADLTGALRDGAGGLSVQRRWFTLRNTLVASQVAASFLLLVAAGLFTRSLSNAERTDVGFRVDDVAFLSVIPSRVGYDDADDLAAFSDRLLDSILAIPGVESAGRVNVPPFRGQDTSTTTIVIEGYEAPTGTSAVELTPIVIGPGYLETLGVPVLYGRNFDDTDDASSEQVAIISETTAVRYYGTSDAVERRLRPQGGGAEDWVRVIGVVADTKVADPTEESRAILYRPIRQTSPFGPMTVMARTSVDADSVVSGLQAAIRQLDPSVPVLEAKTMRRQLEDSLGGAATATAVIGVVGLLALVLACIGLYAVVAFAVSRRSVEIGIRLALGSPNGQLVWLTSRDVLAVVGIGLLFGLGISLALTRALEGFLYGVAPIDPLTLGSVVVLMAAVSSLAAYLPARRAMARNPLEVLRHD